MITVPETHRTEEKHYVEMSAKVKLAMIEKNGVHKLSCIEEIRKPFRTFAKFDIAADSKIKNWSYSRFHAMMDASVDALDGSFDCSSSMFDCIRQ